MDQSIHQPRWSYKQPLDPNEIKTTEPDCIEFRSSDGLEMKIVALLAERSLDVKNFLQNVQSAGQKEVDIIPVHVDSTTIELSVKWHQRLKYVGISADCEKWVSGERVAGWIGKNFIGLDKDLMYDLLSAADYFDLRGLHKVISNDLNARFQLANKIGNFRESEEFKQLYFNKTCLRSSDGQD